MTRILLAATFAALALPGLAFAGGPTLQTREVPLRGAGAGTVAGAFDLVGLHWRGSGSVSFRTRAADGRWSAWRAAAPEDDDRPDAGTREARAAAGWSLGNPWWTGPSDRVQVRARGDVRRVRAQLVTSPEMRVPLRTAAATSAPAIVPRSAWGADESLRQAAPTYAAQIRFAVVHHTAGQNTYTRSEAAAIVRGIQAYHVRSNGWNDIGYNFLVDRYGTVYEGRYGGIERNVVGAHAQGFNTGSVGVALLGTYGDTRPTAAAEAALEQLLAWRLDLAHVDPLSTMTFVSGGSDRFPAGLPVFLRAVSGHRDTGFTACPGDQLYARLGEIAGATQAVGLPKLYEPSVTGTLGGPVRFRARLSAPGDWRVVVTDALGAEVAVGAGAGTALDWTWDASLAPAGGYRWRMEAAGATPAAGTVGGSVLVPLAITGASLDPETITPNDDGAAETTTLTYTLSAPATVTAAVVDILGIQVLELQPSTSKPAGEHAVQVSGAALADGPYTVQLRAVGADGREATASLALAVTRTLAAVTLAPAAFSPNGDGRADTLAVRFRLAAAAEVRVRVLRDDKWVATPFAGPMPAGPRLVRWDGTKRLGRLLDGEYVAVVEATDPVATAVVSVPFASDTRRPTVRILGATPLRVWVSEPAVVTLRVNGRSLRLTAPAPGPLRVPAPGAVRRVRAVAWDAAGNVSLPATSG